MPRLVWPSYELDTLQEVVDVLNVINPKGHSAKHIMAHVQNAFDEGLRSYVGTAGWYVVVYETDNPDVWHAKPMLMAYSVRKYLDGQSETALQNA